MQMITTLDMEAQKIIKDIKSKKRHVSFKAVDPKKLLRFNPWKKADKTKRTFGGYFSLYRYATCKDIPLLFIAVIASILSGFCIPAMAVYFGKLANAMVMLHVIRSQHLTNNSIDAFCTNIIDHKEFNWRNPGKLIHDETHHFFMIFSSLSAAYICLNIILFICWSIPAEKQTVRWATEYVQGLLVKDMEWFDRNFGFEATSDVVENICHVRQGIGIQVPIAISLISTFIHASGCVIWRGYLSWIFIAIAIGVIPFTAFLQQEIDTKTAYQSAVFTQSVVPIVTFAEKVFARIQSVLLHNGQKKELHNFKQKQKLALHMNLSSIVSLSFLNSVMALGLNVYFAMILWQGVDLVWEYRSCHTVHGLEKFDAEVLFSVFGCVMFGMLNVRLLRSMYESFVKARISGTKLAQIIDSKTTVEPHEDMGVILPQVTGRIEFEDVRFSYPMNKTVPVLKGLSFSIQPGWKVGFVGVLGTGLSTIFKLLLQNYLPDCGFIRLDDADIRTLDRSWYLSCLGYVTHDPLIFNDTVEENIRQGNPSATLDEIQDACKEAEVHDLILQLNNGYRTIAGEHGEFLSPQLRVQIAVARVLLQKPKVLLFDEPTLTLDWQSSCFVERILDKVGRNRTTLLIPHRFHFLSNADMIFVIKNGEVVEKGSHEELMKKQGEFYQMINQPDITPGRRLELAKINKVFLGKQLLPPFSFPKFWTNIGFPSIMGVTTTQVWLESKLATPTFGENSFDEEPVGRHLAVTPPPPQLTPTSHLVDKVSSDYIWKKCIIKEDKYFTNPTSGYTPKDDENIFCCWSVLRLTSTSTFFVIIGTIASCMLGLLTPLYAYFLGKSIEILGMSDKKEAFEECKKCAIYLLFLGLGSFVVVFIKTTVLESGSLRCFKKVQRRLFTAILRQELRWFELPENNNHALQTRLSRDVAGVKYIVKTFYDAVGHYSTAVISCTATAFWLSSNYGALCLVPLFVSITSTLLDATLVTHIEEARKDRIKLLRGLIAELCNKRQCIRALQLQPYFLNRLKTTIESTYTSRKCMILVYVRALTFGFSQGGALFMYAVAMLLGVQYMNEDELKFSTVIMVSHLMVVEMMKVGVAISILPTVTKALVCGANILQIIKRQPKICLDKGNAKEISGEVEFRNVHFWFECLPNLRLLNEISFKVKAGKTLAIVGVAGSGKSICLQLLLRLRDAPLGTVEVDGEDIRNLNCVQLRQQIALLSSEPLIDDQTVKEFIAYADNSRQVEDGEIIEATKKANIHLLISSLPKGYDTVLGSAQLTIGQKRRILLARMFLKNPKILLIEESSTALDSESERKILSSLERLRSGRTCIILAHRVRTAQLADYILVFHQGKIRERGTHKQLMASGGVYKQIFEAQSGKNNLFESTLIHKFEEDVPYNYGDFEVSSVTFLKPKRSASLPNVASDSPHPSSTSLGVPSLGFEEFADNIVHNISRGFLHLFSSSVRKSKSMSVNWKK